MPDARCAPCYDPLEGGATGACELGGDPGPSQPPATFASCCGGAGRCIPRAQVPAESASRLDADTCQGGPLCVPRPLAGDPNAVPPTCRAAQTNAEGRCLMECLPEVRPGRDRLGRQSCAAGERCVPCYDPISGESTGACTFSPSDPGPSEPPYLFASCCGGQGLCVPSSSVPAGADLPVDSCSASGAVCAPREQVEGNPAQSCTSSLGNGVCLDPCFLPPGLIAFAQVGSCAASERCAPCNLFGSATGACP